MLLQISELDPHRWYVIFVFSVLFAGHFGFFVSKLMSWMHYKAFYCPPNSFNSTIDQNDFGSCTVDIDFLLTHPVVCLIGLIPGIMIFHCMGLAKTLCTGALISFTGHTLRLISSIPALGPVFRITLVEVGEGVADLFVPFTALSLVYITATWFPPRERIIALTVVIASASFLMGMGSLLPVLFFPAEPDANSWNMFYMEIVPVVYDVIGIFFAFCVGGDRPTFIPSPAIRSCKRPNLFDGALRLFTNPQFYALGLTFAVVHSLPCTFYVTRVVSFRLGYTESRYALAAIGLFASTLGSVFFAYLARNGRSLTALIKAYLIGFTFVTCLENMYLRHDFRGLPDDIVLIGLVACHGFFLFALFTAIYELSAEALYPVRESFVMTFVHNFFGSIGVLATYFVISAVLAWDLNLTGAGSWFIKVPPINVQLLMDVWTGFCIVSTSVVHCVLHPQYVRRKYEAVNPIVINVNH